MKHRKILLISIFYSLFACGTKENDFIFTENRFSNFKDLKLEAVIAFEKENGSKERNYNNSFRIGEDYYPNKKRYDLSFPKIFERAAENFDLETDYFFVEKDSSIKVILYQWNNKNSSFSDTLHIDYNNPANSKIFKNQFEDLKKEITNRLGKPEKVDIIKEKIHSMSFQCAYKWKASKLNAYLSLHDDQMSFREIRLIVYDK